MDWAALFAIIIKLIGESSAQGRSRDRIRKSLTEPTGRDMARLWVGLGRNGVRGAGRREYMQGARDLVGNVSGDLIESFLDEGMCAEADD